MSDRIDPEILDTYLAGEATPEDSARVRELLDLHPGQRKVLEGLMEKLPVVNGVVSAAPDPRAALQRFKDRETGSSREVREGWRYSGRALPRWVGYGSIAALVIAAVISWQAFPVNRSQPST